MLLRNFSGSANSRPLIVFFGSLSSMRWTGASGLILRRLLDGSLSLNSSGNSLMASSWYRRASSGSRVGFQGVLIPGEAVGLEVSVRWGLS